MTSTFHLLADPQHRDAGLLDRVPDQLLAVGVDARTGLAPSAELSVLRRY